MYLCKTLDSANQCIEWIDYVEPTFMGLPNITVEQGNVITILVVGLFSVILVFNIVLAGIKS